MRKRSAALATIACALTAAVTFGAGSPAYASIDATVVVQRVGSTGNAGSMTHEDVGDIFAVWDRVADGHGVRGSLIDGSGTTLKSIYNGNGNGTNVKFAYDIKPGNTYYMKVCLVDGASDTTPIKCAMGYVYE
ncbi:hypothetical protein AB0M47_03735 [Hamadaea sp. NPDC051192]|uniref:hypothetical protein n=1 Tax=Hamadaea sp. NPDC051192 TaxID=3154940 RepID=UPI003413ADCE